MDDMAGGLQPRSLADVGSRHAASRHEDADVGRDLLAHRGDRLFIRCEGGPCMSRLETFPPRLEIPEQGGLYILVDDGPVDGWTYEFVPTFGRSTAS